MQSQNGQDAQIWVFESIEALQKGKSTRHFHQKDDKAILGKLLEFDKKPWFPTTEIIIVKQRLVALDHEHKLDLMINLDY